MKRPPYYVAALAAVPVVLLFNLFCQSGEKKEAVREYLNHNDSVKYVGIQTCRSCHPGIYNSFIQTGMGQSFNVASRQKSSADFSGHQVVYDQHRDMYYRPFFRNDSMYIMEYRMGGRDTLHQRTEKVSFIVGSGQHTNSHIMDVNGYLYQLPLTWYAQKKKWDLPPGFEQGRNVRFSREIGIECMSCHNALPGYVENSVNRFNSVPAGIDCERCHGPGEVHVREKLAGIITDTANQIDYTIVNPKKLTWERQIDVCQRCHLQGNAVLKNGRSFADFKPGKKLSDFIDVYMPKYKGHDDEFIMASHAQRLQMSKCFLFAGNNHADRPKLTCITCHNPHISVKVTGKQVFNNACGNCHDMKSGCKERYEVRLKENDNCVKCHMPRSGTIDIPHVTVTDHWIQIPAKRKEKEGIKAFAGIYCINNKTPEASTTARAYLSYYETFEGEYYSLDSAAAYLSYLKQEDREAIIHYLFLKQDFRAIALKANTLDVLSISDPWTCYRIGQAFQNVEELMKAELWYRRALSLSESNIRFMNKLGQSLIGLDKTDEAIHILKVSLGKNPKQEDAWTDLGFAYLKNNRTDLAMQCYDKALALDPDFQQALLNKAGLYNLTGKRREAGNTLRLILKRDPQNSQVKALLETL